MDQHSRREYFTYTHMHTHTVLRANELMASSGNRLINIPVDAREKRKRIKG